MCGIAGYILGTKAPADAGRLRLLADGIRQRGPDDEGVVLVDRATRSFIHGVSGVHDVTLLHARFSIIDLSSAGHQPFFSQDAQCAVIFNGEIYNYIELKDELSAAGVVCRTASDTEVLAEGWRLWGHGLWPKLNGFWAVAVYDKVSNGVILCRDRLGVAPLYYRQTTEGLFFASLIDPLRQVAPQGERINEDAVRGYLSTGLKDHDHTTCYAEIHSLPEACAVTLMPGISFARALAQAHVYWQLPSEPLSEKEISFEVASAMLERTFTDAVRLRLRADVPVAFELSGGLDSSCVVAAAARLSDKPITAYTIKVRDKDESFYAAAVARRFNVDHRVLADIENDMPRDALAFARVMEEPYDTPANYVHHQMLKMIKGDGFKVVLTGAGGDETLAGYESAFWPAAYRALKSEGHFGQAQIYEFARRYRSWPQGMDTLAGYGRSAVRLLGLRGRQDVSPALGSSAAQYHSAYHGMDFFNQRLFHCRVGLLPYYLRSTDHYTLNIPVEHRFPWLDYRLVELGLRLPPGYLFKGGWTKYILRRSMGTSLPSSVLWRKKKMGFPFAFHSYFASREDQLAPYLKIVTQQGYCPDQDYTSLAAHDPVRLWRLLSVGIWLKAMRREGG
ncbi:MAG: asparagine synthase (glutamine-hydrolyzing) [Candidatus Omnitrophica bacterium]|nr:asparagine synthase (glutamine-hydrolyzing) [Candidatus Omnitrophota bacterium]